ncbi:MAG: hypothetical protein KGV44_13095, partial [Flavobacteriaceae bacterium]|nr:hypothetical protein [Flavobacteriaceae bacterium]
CAVLCCAVLCCAVLCCAVFNGIKLRKKLELRKIYSIFFTPFFIFFLFIVFHLSDVTFDVKNNHSIVC